MLTPSRCSEDLSRRTRESRAELRKYMRKIKRSDPAAATFIQHDKLYVNNKIFVWNDLQGRVRLFSRKQCCCGSKFGSGSWNLLKFGNCLLKICEIK